MPKHPQSSTRILITPFQHLTPWEHKEIANRLELINGNEDSRAI